MKHIFVGRPAISYLGTVTAGHAMILTYIYTRFEIATIDQNLNL